MSEHRNESETTIHGVLRGGVVRLLEPSPWADGTQVAVQLAPMQDGASAIDIGHVIVAGFGLAGRWVVDIFDRHGIEYVVVEQNPETVKRCKLLGKKFILGDISEEATLVAAGIDRAGILALTVPDEKAVLQATKVARRLNPEIYMVARTTYTSSGMEASQLGADAVVKAEEAVANRFYELILHKIRANVASE